MASRSPLAPWLASSGAPTSQRFSKRGSWPKDTPTKGVKAISREALKTIPPIWPKLWRRLQAHLGNHNSLAGFEDWLDEADERVDDIPDAVERELYDYVEVKGDS